MKAPWWLETLICCGCMVTAVLIIAALTGCASTSREAEICYMKPLGVTEEGFTVAAVQCMTPEAFQESQK